MNPKQAIVTGASEGIGRAFVLALARQGYTVLAVARRAQALSELMLELPGEGHGFVVADLATSEGVELVRQRLRDTRVHLLVNNAGVGAVGGFQIHHESVHRHLIQLNITALTDLSLAFLQQAEPGDALINVSSILGFAPHPEQPVYAATKAFVTSLSESLWYECKAKGVLVMGLHPGATATRFGHHSGRAADWKRPAWMLSSPEKVVAVAMRALLARRGPNVVPGRFSQLFVFFTRLLPRRLLVNIMGKSP